MAALRLRNLAVFNSGLFRGYSGFSTISVHQLKHSVPTKTSTRYLPQFLDPRIYWNSSKSGPRAKEQHEKRPWNPATFYIVRRFLLPAKILWHNSTWEALRLISRLEQAIFLLIGSQAIQIIALRLSHDERMRRADVKIEILREVVDRLQRGEEVDVEGMLGVGNEKDEKSWEEGMLRHLRLANYLCTWLLIPPIVLKEIEEEDATWQAKARKKLSGAPPSDTNPYTGPDSGGRLEAKSQQKVTPIAQQARSARDYGFS